jgi:hypothetical protein
MDQITLFHHLPNLVDFASRMQPQDYAQITQNLAPNLVTEAAAAFPLLSTMRLLQAAQQGAAASVSEPQQQATRVVASTLLSGAKYTGKGLYKGVEYTGRFLYFSGASIAKLVGSLKTLLEVGTMTLVLCAGGIAGFLYLNSKMNNGSAKIDRVQQTANATYEEVQAVHRQLDQVRDESRARFDTIDRNTEAARLAFAQYKEEQASRYKNNIRLMKALEGNVDALHAKVDAAGGQIDTLTAEQAKQGQQLTDLDETVKKGFTNVNGRLDGLGEQLITLGKRFDAFAADQKLAAETQKKYLEDYLKELLQRNRQEDAAEIAGVRQDIKDLAARLEGVEVGGKRVETKIDTIIERLPVASSSLPQLPASAQIPPFDFNKFKRTFDPDLAGNSLLLGSDKLGSGDRLMLTHK